MTTAVPALTIGATGPVIPDEDDILAGRLTDLQGVFGGDLSEELTTPQGQIASSDAAIVGDVYGVVAQLVAGCDPATSSGRMQDGIGNFYFLERNPAQSTVVTVACKGKTNTLIPINAKIPDGAGNLYLCTQSGTIPAGGSIDLEFACATTGPIACPINFISGRPYQAIPGWDSGTNAAAGVIGNVVESPRDFEYRRALSVAIGATGTTGAVLGLLLSVPGVLDGWAYENELGVTSGASFTGSITGNVLNVTAIGDGELDQGQMLLGATQGSAITGLLSGSGGIGTYSLSISEPTPIVGASLSSAVGGVRLVPNSIIAVAYGGAAADIGAAILRKKNPGCNYNGNTSVSVQDTNPAYSTFPSYKPKYLIPTPTPILFSVAMERGPNIPTDAIAQIQAAMIAAFNGADGKGKARVAGVVLASRYYGGIGALGDWALIDEILVGIDAPTQRSIRLRADQIPTLAAANIAVAFG